ncbi:ChbG/HpnK family deacetylase [Limoniibacter endophyticus]|uniref:ChbG/HpnK family deacetylase n=1 Tax=Limoniibacter endophyticus TaxID=1565040 RepID=A0A8J3DGQ2_9HYPH|nr:ChbG/HpnK family deacetylase [Limoniibacter endophyticus]GHC65650.1 hypothetical protein GCM10010136_08490 [Limoniibacter endophyticus]
MAEDRKLLLLADDYALSHGISAGIRTLIKAGKISGTGCMTLFPEWKSEVAALREIERPGAQVGLHMTLTDFAPLSSNPLLARHGNMPDLRSLIAATLFTRKFDDAIHTELDAQLDAFTQYMGHAPHYIDGHQHVHFLPPVRRWFAKRAAQWADSSRPWLRGAPTFAGATSTSIRTKIAFASFLALGFEDAVSRYGYEIRGPLCGFYDWQEGRNFEPMLRGLQRNAPSDAVVMCHPGYVDDLLRQRDVFVEARQTEFNVLLNGNYAAL